MSKALHPVLCVVGPTAVGKSVVADEVAKRLGGEVVSVDSMQVYRGMDIGTAKSRPSERTCALHMVDVANVDESYSVVRFQRDARGCIDKLIAQGKPAVLCGGTGLYLDAVIDEMSFPHGETGSSARSRYEALAQREGPEALHAMLVLRDPRSAQVIHPQNVRRVVRALEMLDEGVSYAKHHEGLKRRERHYDAHLWALAMPREQLYARIDLRVDIMFEQGLVDEVAGLVAEGLTKDSTAGAAIGYKEVMRALEGEITLDEARSLVKRNSRRYAKRQLSWLRRDGRARWIDMTDTAMDTAVQTICDDWRNITT